MSDVDVALAGIPRRGVLGGHTPVVGEQTVAAIGCLHLELRMNGDCKLPRSLRGLKGWKWLLPRRNDRPLQVATWFAWVTELVRTGPWWAALGGLICLAVYLRTAKLLAIELGGQAIDELSGTAFTPAGAGPNFEGRSDGRYGTNGIG